jgi:hypothetical protein
MYINTNSSKFYINYLVVVRSQIFNSIKISKLKLIRHAINKTKKEATHPRETLRAHSIMRTLALIIAKKKMLS